VYTHYNIAEKKFIVINHLDNPQESRAMLWLKFSNENALYEFLGTQFIPQNRSGLFQKNITLGHDGIESETSFKISLENHPKDTCACVLRFPNEALKVTSRKSGAHPKAEILESYKNPLLGYMKVLLPEENWDTKIDTETKFAKTGSPLEHTILNLNKKKQQQRSLGIKEKLTNYLEQPFPKSKLFFKIVCAAFFAGPFLTIMLAVNPTFLSLPFVIGAITTTASAVLGFWSANILNQMLWGHLELRIRLSHQQPYISKSTISGLNLSLAKKSLSELKEELTVLHQDHCTNTTPKEIKQPVLFSPRDVSAAKKSLSGSDQAQLENTSGNINKQSI